MIIPNQSNINFNSVLPDGQTITGELDSNIVNTEILTYSVTKIKNSDKTFMQEGETSHHYVTISNTSEALLFNNVFKDTMSAGASYVPGSVKVNGVAQPSYDPIAGFPLPNIEPTEIAEIEYVIKADNPKTVTPVTNYATLNYTVDDPVRGNVNYSENTNTISIDIISNAMTVAKSVDKALAIKGDNLHYTSVVTNTGTINKTVIVFKDPIPAGTTFVADSVKINGVSYPAYNPAVGFNLPDLAPDAAATIEFDVKVN